MAPSYYPKANRTVQNFGQGNSNMGSINKILLHSTETQGWPAYGGAGGHPTLTYNPWTHQWRQHLPILGSATALMNDGSFQTNRDHVVQIEIVGYSDQNTAKKYGHSIDDIDAAGLKDLGEFIAWMHENYGVKIASTVTWKPYPSSYGVGNGVRLSLSGFKNYRGVLGHQHAPGNYHGDPGDLAVAKIIAYAKAGLPSPTPQPAKKEWHGKLRLTKKSVAYNKAGKEVTTYPAGKEFTGYVDTGYAKDVGSTGRYFRVWKIPHRLWIPLDNHNFEHLNGKAV